MSGILCDRNTMTPPSDRIVPREFHFHVVFSRMDSSYAFDQEIFTRLIAFLVKVEEAKKQGLFFVVTPLSEESVAGGRREGDIIYLAPIGPWSEGNLEINVAAEEYDNFNEWLKLNYDPLFYYLRHPVTNYAFYDHIIDSALLFSPDISKAQFMLKYMTQDMDEAALAAFKMESSSVDKNGLAWPGQAFMDTSMLTETSSVLGALPSERVVDKVLMYPGGPKKGQQIVIQFTRENRQDVSNPNLVNLSETYQKRELGYAKLHYGSRGGVQTEIDW